MMLCDLVLSTIKQHIYAKPVKWSVRLFLDNITLMFLLNFQVEVIINMFIKVFKVKLLIVSYCYLTVISDSCEPCLGSGGASISRIPKTKQNRQISHIPKIDFRSKPKNIPKNTQNDNAISHIPVIQRTHIPYP
jgi:hypothetical protein